MKKSNQELIAEYHETSKKMRELADAGKLEERNSYLPRIQELNTLIDWGFKAGDTVERRTGRGWERDTILEVENASFHFRTMIMPPLLLRKVVEKCEKVSKEAKSKKVRYEQVSLF